MTGRPQCLVQDILAAEEEEERQPQNVAQDNLLRQENSAVSLRYPVSTGITVNPGYLNHQRPVSSEHRVSH